MNRILGSSALLLVFSFQAYGMDGSRPCNSTVNPGMPGEIPSPAMTYEDARAQAGSGSGASDPGNAVKRSHTGTGNGSGSGSFSEKFDISGTSSDARQGFNLLYRLPQELLNKILVSCYDLFGKRKLLGWTEKATFLRPDDFLRLREVSHRLRGALNKGKYGFWLNISEDRTWTLPYNSDELQALFQKADDHPFMASRVYGLKCAGNIYINDAVLQGFVVFFPNLKTLNLDRCGYITSDGFGVIAKLADLKELDTCPATNDANLMAIADGIPGLERLRVSIFANVGTLGLNAIARLEHLKKLDISCCSRAYDADLVAIANGCPNLEQLKVTYCKNIRANGFKAIAQLKHLKRLDISNTCATDEDLVAIVNGIPNLERLNLENCEYIRTRDFVDIIARLTNLEKLSIPGTCEDVKATVVAIAKRIPGLKHLRLPCNRFQTNSFAADELRVIRETGTIREIFQWR